MSSHDARTRKPIGEASATVSDDADLVAQYVEDAAHVPGGHASGVARPRTEADVAALVGSSRRVLAVGAQSSLTGGATPRGETVLSMAGLNRIAWIEGDLVRVEAGVTLDALEAGLAAAGRCYPPVPTFTGAFAGGVVATNAAGAATFKHGTTRQWVQALTIVLPSGDVLDIERGEVRAHEGGYFDLERPSGTTRIPVPTYRMPSVPKISAGYFAAPGMDLVDLFVGSEGTLGIVTAVTLRTIEARPGVCRAFVPFPNQGEAFAAAARMRDAALLFRTSGGRHGVDVAAIEHVDRRGLEILQEDGADRAAAVRIPAGTQMALLVTIEFDAPITSETAFEEIGRARDPGAPDTPLVRFCTLLAGAGVLDDVEIAVPGQASRHKQLLAVREAVPAAVNARIARAQRAVDARIEKTAGDLLVPFAHIEAFTDRCEREMRRRGLDAAIWGHLSDGNLHPNVIARTYADVAAGREALLALGRDAIRLGGVPLAEHGVGRSPVKQRLLVELYGERGVDEMRAVKRAVDPGWKLAPGVLFPA